MDIVGAATSTAVSTASRKAHAATLLWLNLCTHGRAHDVEQDCTQELSRNFHLVRCDRPSKIDGVIEQIRPDVLCFAFDTPDAAGLQQLRATKLQHPGLPILMLSDKPSVELAIWALRTRVWDFLIRPVTAGEIGRRINILTQVTHLQRERRARPVYLPQQIMPTETLTGDPGEAPHAGTEPALSHLHAHFHSKITLADIAARCGMDPYAFSRQFKRAHGLTFRDYLIRYRLNAACTLLRDTDRDMLDIALASGFNDASHFSRSFRQHIGSTPTAYRLEYDTGPSGPGCAAGSNRRAAINGVTMGRGDTRHAPRTGFATPSNSQATS